MEYKTKKVDKESNTDCIHSESVIDNETIETILANILEPDIIVEYKNINMILLNIFTLFKTIINFGSDIATMIASPAIATVIIVAEIVMYIGAKLVIILLVIS